jgi:integrase
MTGDSAKSTSRPLTGKPENRDFITDKTIERLLRAKAVNRIIWDVGAGSVKGKPVYACPGFGVRTTASGQVAFIFNYHQGAKGHRKEHRIKIGDHNEVTVNDAREQARAWSLGLKDGLDPVQDRRVQEGEPTFAELAAAWLKYAKAIKKKRESSLYDDRLMLGVDEKGKPLVDDDPAMRKRRILPIFGERRLSEITQSEIGRFHAALSETPYRANRTLVLIKTIFNYGMTKPEFKDWIESNPAEGIGKFPEEKRESCLKKDEGEITKFLQALDAYNDQNSANCLRLLLLTGSRENEALKATWGEFNLTRGLWTKPSHHTKQKKTEHVPLSAPALDLLRSMKPKNAIGPLFPGRKAGHRVSLKRPWVQACKAAGLVEEYEIPGKRKNKDGSPRMLTRYRPTVRIHDLRHTFASVLVSSGESLYAVGKSLGHVQASTTQRYAHFAPDAQRAVANKFAEVIEFKKPA